MRALMIRDLMKTIRIKIIREKSFTRSSLAARFYSIFETAMIRLSLVSLYERLLARFHHWPVFQIGCFTYRPVIMLTRVEVFE